MEGILEKHKAVFDEKNETITEFIAKLRLKDNAQEILYALLSWTTWKRRVS